MKSMDIKVLAWIIGASFIVVLSTGIMWALWELWCFVLPKFYPTGPSDFIHPSFWLFVAGWVLFVTLARELRGSGK